jgi:hypothetical protein
LVFKDKAMTPAGAGVIFVLLANKCYICGPFPYFGGVLALANKHK